MASTDDFFDEIASKKSAEADNADAFFDEMSIRNGKPASPKLPQRSLSQEIGRQSGLTARYIAEGPAQALDIFGQPIRAIGEMAGIPHTQSMSSAVSNALTRLGLPSPETPSERIVGDVSRMLSSGASVIGGTNKIAGITTGLTRQIAQTMSSNPGMQAVSAMGSGAAGGAARESGAGPRGQFVASLLGGVLAPLAASNALTGAARVTAPFRAISPDRVDNEIRIILGRSGIDWESVPSNVRNILRDEVGSALSSGADLNGDAVRRLADFARINGATPTRGMLTLDPVQITRERNLAKSGANSSDSGLHGLALVENNNNRAMINALNDIGASNAKSSYQTGERMIDALSQNLKTQKATIGELYGMARDNAGRSFPLDGRQFADTAIKNLDDNLLGGSLPSDVRKHINAISQGEVPFTVDYAEQLKTLIGNLQRASNDGSARMALGVVRRALDETPVLPLGEQAGNISARNVNPGNLPAVPGAVDVGQDAIDAFTRARKANRQMMQDIERTPALRSVYDESATPDDFVNKFVIGSSASAKDVSALNDAISHSPETLDTVRAYLAQWIKNKALNGASDEVGNFSASAYNKAIKSIGDEKLKLYFKPDEIEQLKSIGRVSSYMNAQPKGSAINNSNSGALLVGRGLDFLNAIGSKIPVFGFGPQIQGVASGLQQKSAINISPALLRPPSRNNLIYPVPALLSGEASADDQDGK